MFPDFSKLGEMMPKIDQFFDSVKMTVSQILEEQKAQRAMLEDIKSLLKKGQ